MADVASQFTKFYYDTFAANRAGLASLYRDDSQLTWEGSLLTGPSAIVEKLSSLPFAKVQHKILTTDAQSMDNNSKLMIVVTGLLVVDDSTAPLQYSQAFVLKQVDQSFYVQNDVFRLNYGS